MRCCMHTSCHVPSEPRYDSGSISYHMFQTLLDIFDPELAGITPMQAHVQKQMTTSVTIPRVDATATATATATSTATSVTMPTFQTYMLSLFHRVLTHKPAMLHVMRDCHNLYATLFSCYFMDYRESWGEDGEGDEHKMSETTREYTHLLQFYTLRLLTMLATSDGSNGIHQCQWLFALLTQRLHDHWLVTHVAMSLATCLTHRRTRTQQAILVAIPIANSSPSPYGCESLKKLAQMLTYHQQLDMSRTGASPIPHLHTARIQLCRMLELFVSTHDMKLRVLRDATLCTAVFGLIRDGEGYRRVGIRIITGEHRLECMECMLCSCLMASRCR